MLLRSFAHWLFLSLIGLTFLALIVLGLSLLWWGTSGLKQSIDSSYAFYSSNGPAFDFMFRGVGLAVTVLTSLFGIHKALYFAERNLPKRLHDYIEDAKNKLVVIDRNQLLAHVVANPDDVVKNLEARKPELDRIRSVLNKAKESWDYEQATLHYAYGQLSARQADNQPDNSLARRTATKFREEAIEHFRHAAQLDPSDPRALEFAAKQAEALKHHEQAVELWLALAQLQHVRGDEFLQAQALYFCARNYWERSKDPGFGRTQQYEFLREAREKADEASDLLKSRSDPEWCDQLAKCFELLGVVRTSLRTPRKAEAALKEAVQLYGRLGRPEDAGRVQSLIAKVEPSDGEDEEPDGTNYSVGRAYELLGVAHIGRDDIIGSRSKAERHLRLALAEYEKTDPTPEEAISRVAKLLKNPWLQ